MYQQFGINRKLEYPEIRSELLKVFDQIADAETQLQDWVNQESLTRTDTNRLSVLLQSIYISASLATEPNLAIGLFLKDGYEVRLVWAVFCTVERVFQTAGIDAACEIYIACPEWKNLVQAIDRALQVMSNQDKFSRFGDSHRYSLMQ